MEEAGADHAEGVGPEVRLLCTLQVEEFPVPPGFIVLPAAYEGFLGDNGLVRKAREDLGHPETLPPEELRARLEAFRKVFLEAGMAPQLETELREGFQRLVEEGEGEPFPVAVRPFLLPEITGIPLESLAWQDLYDIRDPEQLLSSVRRAWTWAWTGDLFERCVASGVDPLSVHVVLLVQQFVLPRVGGAFLPNRNPESVKSEIVIDACWGMGEAVLLDGFNVDRFVLQDGPLVLLEQNVGSKEKKLIPRPEGGPGLQEVEVPEEVAEMPCLGWEQIQEIAETGLAVEKVAGHRREIHWAYENGDFFLLRAPAVFGPIRQKPYTPASEEKEEREPAEPVEADGSFPRAGRPVRAEGNVSGSEDRNDRPEQEGAETVGGDLFTRRDEPLLTETERQETSEMIVSKETANEEVQEEEENQQASSLSFPSERYPGWRLSWLERGRAELLASLFRSVRKRKGQGGEVQERDEFSHRHTGSRYWNESYYFNFSDPVRKICGFSRIGMVPNQDMVIGILYLFLPDGGILMLTQTEPCRASQDKVSAGLLRYERVNALWSWRIRFQGNMLYLADPAELPSLLQASPDEMAERDLTFRDVSLDLLFRGWSPCHDFKGADPRFVAERFVAAKSRVRDLQAVSKVASEHYEQVGGWQGEVVVDGQKMDVSGSGHRDHSWGDRDWKAPSKWTWLTAQFGDVFGFNLSRVVIRSLDLFNGYVCRSGKNYPLRRAWLDTEFEADGLTQKQVFLRIQDVTGWEAEIQGRPRTVVPLILQDGDDRTLVNEAFTAYRWKGRTGYGISEYLHQLGA
jgi:hypothetical protein